MLKIVFHERQKIIFGIQKRKFVKGEFKDVVISKNTNNVIAKEISHDSHNFIFKTTSGFVNTFPCGNLIKSITPLKKDLR